MAIHPAGISGRMTGKNSGNVFGQARTRWGKMTTSREWVVPRDPKTAEQLLQRELFRRAVQVAGNVGRDIYFDAWNNTLGQLPGWNSLVSWVAQQLEGPIGTITYKSEFTPKNLGPVYMPEISTNVSALAGQISLDWEDDLAGDYSSSTDKLFGFLNKDTKPGSGGPTDFVRIDGSKNREYGQLNINGMDQGQEYFYCVWFQNIDNEGKARYSPVATGLVTPKAS